MNDKKVLQRGTTPTIRFTLPDDAPALDNATVTFLQGRRTKFKRNLSETEYDGSVIELTLTQAETLLLDAHKEVFIQLKPYSDGTVPATAIFKACVLPVLDEEPLGV